MRIRSFALATLIAAVVLFASGCAGDGEVMHGADSVVLVGAEGDGDNLAGVGYGGSVTMVGDCVGIEHATVIWPHGTAIVSEDPLVIDVPGLGRVTVGDHVEGGADEYADHLPNGIDAIPSGCASTHVIAFFPE